MLSETADQRTQPRPGADRSMLAIQYAIAIICAGAAGILALVR